MTNLDTPQQNHLLAALPAAQYERLFSHLERVPYTARRSPLRVGGRVALRLFPHDLHRIQVLRYGEWRVDRNRCGR